MFFYIIALLVCATPSKNYSMMQHAAPLQLPLGSTGHSIQTASFTQPVSQTRESTPADQERISKQNSIFAAIDKGNINDVKKHFQSSYYWVSAWSYHRVDVAAALAHAVRLPRETSGHIVDYLITEVQAPFIDSAKQVLEDAARNGHNGVVHFLEKKFGKEYAQSALNDATEAEDTDLVAALLNAGIEPHIKRDKESTPFEKALAGCTLDQIEQKRDKKLIIVSLMMQKLTDQQITTTISQVFGSNIPASICAKMQALLHITVPQRLCMEDSPSKHPRGSTMDGAIAIGLFIGCPTCAVGIPLICCPPDKAEECCGKKTKKANALEKDKRE